MTRTSFLLFLWAVVMDLAMCSLPAMPGWNNVVPEKDF